MPRRPPHTLSPEQKIVPVLDALRSHYGRPRRQRLDPLEVLVHGVLSQNTTDVNSGRAFRQLMATFGSWEGVAGADVRSIERAIRQGGLAAQKAATIRRTLQWLEGRGGYSLDFLKPMPVRDAERELRAIKGVGLKTARLVLLFAFGKPVFVVDTHVFRVGKRLGLVPERSTRDRAHKLLDALVPARRKYPAHMNMIRHGRQLCHARSPECGECPVRAWCAWCG